MRKITQLFQLMSRVFEVPEATISTRQMLLRKQGLWTRSTQLGRGKLMPDPNPTDVTNILSSFMAGGWVTKCNETVLILRNSRYARSGKGLQFQMSAVLGGGPGPLPELPLFDGLSREHTFGDLMTRLFEHWARDGWLLDATGARLHPVALRVERSGPRWWSTLVLGDDSVQYEGGQAPSYPTGNADELRELIEQEARKPRCVTSREINGWALSALAACVGVEPGGSPSRMLADRATHDRRTPVGHDKYGRPIFEPSAVQREASFIVARILAEAALKRDRSEISEPVIKKCSARKRSAG